MTTESRPTKKNRARKRITIDRGIYRDRYGVDVVVRQRSGEKIRTATARFPLYDPDGVMYGESAATMRELRDARNALEEKLARDPEAQRGRGSFAADIEAFLASIPAEVKRAGVMIPNPKKADFTYLLGHWRDSELGAMVREEIAQADIRRVLEAWRAKGTADVTLNHRIRAIRQCLESFRGAPENYIPTDRLKGYEIPDGENRGMPIDLALYILKFVPDRGRANKGESRPAYSENKIRLRVILFTGLAHKSLMRLPRKSVNFAELRLQLPARYKGKGSPAIWVEMLDDAADALRDYDAAGLWGTKFSRSSMWKSWRRAYKSAKKALEKRAAANDPGADAELERFLTYVREDCTPYDFRHTFLSSVTERTGDPVAVQRLGQHKDPKTTQRYTGSAAAQRVSTAIATMRAAYANLPKTPPIKTDRPRLRKFAVVKPAST